MSESASPRQVFERLLDHVTNRRWSEVPFLYAESAVVEQPFDRPTPRRLEGREQIRAHFNGASGMPLELEVSNVVIHETRDTEVVIGEFDYTGRITSSGRTFGVAYVIVMRVRDGKIVSSRDYHNHAAIGEALADASPEPDAA